MKKMTGKEFFKVLTECGAFEGAGDFYKILNSISLKYSYTAMENADMGMNALAKNDREVSEKIFNYLESVGYYERG